MHFRFFPHKAIFKMRYDWKQAALDKLTDMNQPDGDCCFCMFPLSTGYESSGLRPFLKLMSCFHCFHRFVKIRQKFHAYLKRFDLKISYRMVAVIASVDGSNGSCSNEGLILNLYWIKNKIKRCERFAIVK